MLPCFQLAVGPQESYSTSLASVYSFVSDGVYLKCFFNLKLCVILFSKREKNKDFIKTMGTRAHAHTHCLQNNTCNQCCQSRAFAGMLWASTRRALSSSPPVLRDFLQDVRNKETSRHCLGSKFQEILLICSFLYTTF